MLTFRRPAPAPRTEPAPSRAATPVTPAVSANAEKARALMAMLEQGGDGSATGIAPERLRDWARDLVETVERRRGADRPAPAATAVAARPAPIPSTAAGSSRPATIFTTAAPVLTPAPPPAALLPAALPAATARVMAPMPVAIQVPVAHAPARPRAAPPAAPAAHSRADVQRLLAAAVDPETLAQEHPAVIAMTLAGRPTLEQAAALRRLPGGQIRAVRRALRQLELGAA